MKKLFSALIGIALVLNVQAQSTAIYVPMTSAGGHTAWASGGFQKWTGTSLSYTVTQGGVAWQGYYDTISNKDTSRALTVAVGAKVLTTPFTLVKPNCVYDTVQVKGSYKAGSIMLTLKKVSGTVADTAWILASDNGLNWIPIGQDTALFTNIATTQTYIWQLPGRLRPTNSLYAPSNVNGQYMAFNSAAEDLPYQYYMVYIRGLSATQSAIVKCSILLRPGP